MRAEIGDAGASPCNPLATVRQSCCDDCHGPNGNQTWPWPLCHPAGELTASWCARCISPANWPGRLAGPFCSVALARSIALKPTNAWRCCLVAQGACLSVLEGHRSGGSGEQYRPSPCEPASGRRREGARRVRVLQVRDVGRMGCALGHRHPGRGEAQPAGRRSGAAFPGRHLPAIERAPSKILFGWIRHSQR